MTTHSQNKTTGLFDSAFKKKEEAARIWKEKNDLNFSDRFPSSSPLPTTTEYTAESKSNNYNYSQTRLISPHKEEVTHKNLSIPETITPPATTTTNNNSSGTTVTQTNITTTTTQSPHPTSDEVNTTATDSTSEQKSDARDQVTASTPLTPHTFTQSLENLTTAEKAIVTSFIIALLYLHLSFHSLQEVLSYDYLALLSLTSQRVATSLPLLSPDLSPLRQRIEEVFHRLTYVDVIVIPVLLTQLVVLFDWSPERTDFIFFSCTRLIANQVTSWRTSLSSFVKETRSDVTRLYEQYQQKTPRVFRILLALSLTSFIVRYVLVQAISALTWFFQTIVYPWRYYGLAGLAIVGAVSLAHLYLARQQSRKEVVVKLSQHVKELLEKKEEQQAVVDYLYSEINDHVIKSDLATPSKPHKWWKIFSSSEVKEVREEKEGVVDDVSEGLSLGGHTLPSLWNEVQKEVGKDKRVRTFLMFVDGAQQKCWKIMSNNNNYYNPTISQPSSSQQPDIVM